MRTATTRRLSVLAGVCVLIIGLVLATRPEGAPAEISARAPLDSAIRRWSCPSGTVGQTECMFVSVPEDYSDPEIRSIELFVATIDPPADPTGPPIVYTGDDLGDVVVGEFGDWYQVARATGRRVVLIDHRGSGRSEPRLGCDDLSTVPWLEAQLGGEGLEQARNALAAELLECRNELAGRVALEAYTLDAMATDFDRVREVLGIQSWAVAGAGETTLIARRIEELFGGRVEQLLLLGANETNADPHIQRYDNARSVLDEVLGPELLAQLDADVAPLDRRSIVFAVTSGGRTRRVSVSPEVVHPIFARAAGDDELRATFPALITERLSEGQWRSMAILRAQQYRTNNSWASGIAFAVLCAEPTFASAEPLWDAVDGFDSSWIGLNDDPTLDPALCRAWRSPVDAEGNEVVAAPLDRGVADTPRSPTLVINGEYDVWAPERAAEQLRTSWPSADVVTLSEGGRPSLFDPCVLDLFQRFLDPAEPMIEGRCS